MIPLLIFVGFYLFMGLLALLHLEMGVRGDGTTIEEILVESGDYSTSAPTSVRLFTILAWPVYMWEILMGEEEDIDI